MTEYVVDILDPENNVVVTFENKITDVEPPPEGKTRPLFGPHISYSFGNTIEETKRAKPPIIKVLDYDMSFLSWMRENSPETFIVGRYFLRRDQQHLGSNPIEAQTLGIALANKILALDVAKVTVNGRKLFDAWETYNEVLSTESDRGLFDQYDYLQAAFAQRMLDGGFETVALNFSNGNLLPEQVAWFPRILGFTKLVGFHEYDWPVLWRAHEIGLGNGDGGMHLALRYRRLMAEVHRLYSPDHKAIITECGLTQGVCGGDDVGWRSSRIVLNQGCVSYLNDFPISAADYWRSLAWYHGELCKDAYVLGATVYCCGCQGDWISFESTDFIKRFRELAEV